MTTTADIRGREMAEAAEEWPIRNVEIVDDHWVDLTIDFGDGITTIYRIAREG